MNPLGHWDRRVKGHVRPTRLVDPEYPHDDAERRSGAKAHPARRAHPERPKPQRQSVRRGRAGHKSTTPRRRRLRHAGARTRHAPQAFVNAADRERTSRSRRRTRRSALLGRLQWQSVQGGIR
jgi:hypothetical protein